MSTHWKTYARRSAWLALIGSMAAGVSSPLLAASTASYDPFGRLKSLISESHTTTYTYDNVGNRTARTVATGGLATSLDVGVDGNATPGGSVVVYHKIAYAVTVSNFSGIAASTVSLTVTPAANMTLLASSAPGWTCSGVSTVTCTLASLAAGADLTLSFDYRPTAVNANAAVTIGVSSAGTDIQPANNSDIVTSVVMSSGSTTDVDGDGMADTWESTNGLSATNGDDGASNTDGDGWTALTEYVNGTDPNNGDTDGDSLKDDIDPNPLFNPAWITPALQLLR